MSEKLKNEWGYGYFAKKPPIVEAMAFDLKHIRLCKQFCHCLMLYHDTTDDYYIPCVDGSMHLKDGDYIIKENGIFYVVDGPEFRKNYRYIGVGELTSESGWADSLEQYIKENE